jgi:hypothetical protein
MMAAAWDTDQAAAPSAALPADPPEPRATTTTTNHKHLTACNQPRPFGMIRTLASSDEPPTGDLSDLRYVPASDSGDTPRDRS